MNEQNDAPKLPKGWALTTLDKLCKVQGGFAFKSFDYKTKGFPLIRISNIQEKEIFIDDKTVYLDELTTSNLDDFIIEQGDILIALSGATTGKFGIYKQSYLAYLNQRVGRLRFHAHFLIVPKFVFYFLDVVRKEVLENAYGAAQPNISPTELEGFQIPLPPLNEQARIVAKVEELFTKLDAGIDALRAVRKQLKRYRQAVLRDAVTGELTKLWRIAENVLRVEETGAQLLRRILQERRTRWQTEQLAKFAATGKTPKNDDWKNKYKEPAAPDTENLPELPESWIRVTVGQIIQDLKYGTSQKCELKNVGVPVLRIPNVSNGIIDHSKLKYAELPKVEYEQLKLNSGDILLIRSNGSVSLVGKTALVRDSEKDFAYAGYLIRLKPNENFIQSNFLQFAFSSNEMRKQIEMPARSTSGVHNINSDEVKSLKLSLPPLAEQQKIVEEVERLLSVADAVEAIIEQSLKQAARLRQSILKRAFAGELVAQDDADEPAAVLLERIKHERSATNEQRNKDKSKQKETPERMLQAELPYENR